MNDSAVASAAAGTRAAAVVQSHTTALQIALTGDVVHARTTARQMARDHLRKELDRDVDRAAETAALDSAAATAAAAGLAAAWGSAALSGLAAAADGAEARALAKLPGLLDGRARRTASTETAYAFNDETEALLAELVTIRGSSAPRRGDAVPEPGMFKVYSAILDAHTCAVCFAEDGEVVELAKSFKTGPPPLHPSCRCVVEHIIVPKPERLEDIEIDYDLFKEEVADVIREGRARGEREALAFVAESLGSKRSPVALTKRFASEPYATRR